MISCKNAKTKRDHGKPRGTRRDREGPGGTKGGAKRDKGGPKGTQWDQMDLEGPKHYMEKFKDLRLKMWFQK